MASFLFTLKLFLISTALLFTALGFHVSLPLLTEFLLKHVSLTCNKPPYLFLLLNALIVSILASSRFHRSHPSPPPPSDCPIKQKQEVNTVVMATNDVQEQLKNVVLINGVHQEEAPTLDEVWKAITEKTDVAAEVCALSLKRQTQTFTSVSLSHDELNRRVESFIRKVKGQ